MISGSRRAPSGPTSGRWRANWGSSARRQMSEWSLADSMLGEMLAFVRRGVLARPNRARV